MDTQEVDISEIQIGERHRKDMGDLKPLADSIREQSLLQPIGITKEKKLVFGERRLRAVRDELKWEKIPARVVNLKSIIEGEYAENEIRKDFTASERVAIAAEVRKLLSERLGERRGRPDELIPDPGPELGKETRDIAAEKAGFGSGRTLERAEKIVNNGISELVDAVDKKEISIKTGAEIAKKPPKEQKALVAAGGKAAAKKVNADRRKYRAKKKIKERDEVQELIDQIDKMVHQHGMEISYLSLRKLVTSLKAAYAKRIKLLLS